MSSSERIEVKLGDICHKIGSGVTPRGGDNVYIFKGVSLIRSQNIYDFHFSNNGLVFIDNEQAARMKNVEVKSGDVLLNITGDSVARCCTVPLNVLPARVNQHVSIIRPITSLIEGRYLQFFLNNRLTKDLLLSLSSTGGTRNALTKSMIENLKLRLPSILEQKAIADTLSCLDDKIELNTRINKNLEEMAQAIFKSWFVDFEPFQGGEFEDSELGRIPKGWKVDQISEISEMSIGGDWGKETNDENLEPVICLRGTDLQTLKVSGFSNDAPMRWVKRDSILKREIDEVDILIGGSGLGPIGRSMYCSNSIKDLYEYPIIFSNFCKKIKCNNKQTAIYLETVFENMYFDGRMRNFFNGTSIPNLDANGLMKQKILIPTDDCLTRFAEYKNVLFLNKFSQENTILCKIRDSLLPKLMGGEIRIPVQED